jgi:hypothetical protein
MKNITKLILLLLLLGVASPGQAQTATVRTTLTTATTSTSGTETLTVGSTTGMSASTNSAQTYLLVDGELMRVTAVPSATTVTVTRAFGGVVSRHAANAEVRYGPGGARWDPATGNTSGVFLPAGSAGPSGSCTRASNRFLPVFLIDGAVITAFDCPNSVSTTTGRWISWQYYPATSEVAARTEPACQAGSTASCVAYTALVSDYYIGITTEFTPDGATFTVTLPCSSVPAGKVWIVGYEGLGAGTTGNGVSILGSINTQQILTGNTARGYISNGTNCLRLW